MLPCPNLLELDLRQVLHVYTVQDKQNVTNQRIIVCSPIVQYGIIYRYVRQRCLYILQFIRGGCTCESYNVFDVFFIAKYNAELFIVGKGGDIRYRYR